MLRPRLAHAPMSPYRAANGRLTASRLQYHGIRVRY